MRRAAILLAILPLPAAALDLDAPFASIDGGTLAVSDYAGQPVLLVNTASQCGFTGQYDGLQALHDRYADRGLVVLAVPSDDFAQELGSNAEVKDFCEVNFGLTIPMTEITPVRGRDAHPLFRSLAEEAGYAPRWNFYKVLIGPEGDVVASFPSTVRPTSDAVTGEIDALLD